MCENEEKPWLLVLPGNCYTPSSSSLVLHQFPISKSGILVNVDGNRKPKHRAGGEIDIRYSSML